LGAGGEASEKAVHIKTKNITRRISVSVFIIICASHIHGAP
jgi:hypothetical protein